MGLGTPCVNSGGKSHEKTFDLMEQALQTLQADEVAAMRQGYALDNDLKNMESKMEDEAMDTHAMAWADLEAKQTMEGEAMHKQWRQRQSDYDELKQAEMQALITKQQHATNAIHENEVLDQDSMAKRHALEQTILQRNLAHDQEVRRSQAQMARDVLASKQTYEANCLELLHDRQRQNMRHKQQQATADGVAADYM
ncbi:hypothetical protein H257_14620 [Aphanomyces astaci]|uniref:Uncharacterized protein n=1 Tax=Aphanomyces astaci TaxID=112090 RepID=W4FQM5_APHAT|nr:hypothetical protein H257_14620 [Aphanomyces astaci]ETV69795.1 hypothetical protein H257_14620 [Aphanomyces astaci]RQM22653.1 hypothetical protein B5M09_005403 [Aphanomyces astaci]|eukprot:XP_009840809.1 hypothetical protein H257_14620 [Aphanomyces astaci]